jgi:serine/threonine-protein kinase
MSETGLLNNRYQLERKLDIGGMATVYLARDMTLERSVAIKVLRSEYSKGPDFRERFRQEAKAAANLSHSNIVTIHDFGFDQNSLFIVMEYVPGDTLKHQIDKRGRFTIAEAIPIIVQACAGIGYAHRAGLVHCDIKPQNILVSPDKRVKVTDFGIARALASIDPGERTDVVWGSPQYFSPEQASGKAPSPASDVYGLGVILYEMVTGQLPFTANTSVELSQLHQYAAPKPPRQINPAISPDLEHIILKVLSKEPSARYRTADQLGRVLITFAETPPYSQTAQTSKIHAKKSSQQTILPTPQQYFPSPQKPNQPISDQPLSTQQRVNNEIDWITTGLGLTALLAVGGLLPFLLWVYYTINRLP